MPTVEIISNQGVEQMGVDFQNMFERLVPTRTARRKVKGSSDAAGVAGARKAFYGRASSVVNQIGANLEFLNEARNFIVKMPTIDPDGKTIVIAGYPNVGKSYILKRISTGQPGIASYPFTTKGINIGHLESGYERYQVIDTPGLLDRPLEERNDIELKAVLAIRHLATVILFVLDPSEYCGYHMDAQLHLLDAVRESFDAPVLVVENKVDLLHSESENMKVSAETGEGLDELVEALIKQLAD